MGWDRKEEWKSFNFWFHFLTFLRPWPSSLMIFSVFGFLQFECNMCRNGFWWVSFICIVFCLLFTLLGILCASWICGFVCLSLILKISHPLLLQVFLLPCSLFSAPCKRYVIHFKLSHISWMFCLFPPSPLFSLYIVVLEILLTYLQVHWFFLGGLLF